MDHDGKEKVQFGLLINSKWSGKFMRIQLKNSVNTLDIGLTESGELFIEFFKQSLVQPSYIVPQVWHKGGFQLLDMIITELKSHMTCYNAMPLIG